jgi:hypothetical protein
MIRFYRPKLGKVTRIENGAQMIPRNTTQINLPLNSAPSAAGPSPRSGAWYSSLASRGFVDVLDERSDVSNYPLKRTRSASSFESEGSPLFENIVLKFFEVH